MLDLFQGFQKAIEAFVIPLVIAVGSLLLLMTLSYLIVILFHLGRRWNIENLRINWRSVLREIENSNSSSTHLGEQKFSSTYREEFMNELKETGLSQNERLKAYNSTGYYEKDLEDLLSKTWWKRVQALNRLKFISPEDLENKLKSLLYDENHEVRLLALDSLSYLEATPEIEPVRLFNSFTNKLDTFLCIKLLAIEPDESFVAPMIDSGKRRHRRAGAILLGQPGRKRFIPLLKELADDEAPSVRRRAVESLGKVGSTAPISILSQTSKDVNPSVRKVTAKSLGKIKDETSVEILDRLADSDNFSVQLAAFQSLAGFGESGRKIIGKYWGKNGKLAREAIFESYQG